MFAKLNKSDLTSVYTSCIGDLRGGYLCSDDTYAYGTLQDNWSNRYVAKWNLSNWKIVNCKPVNGDSAPYNPNFQGIATDGTYVYVTDYGNNCIIKIRCSDLSFVQQKSGPDPGAGNEDLNQPQQIACDGTYIYICEYGNFRIKKLLASDLSYVAKIGSQGAGDNQFENPAAISTDGTNVYVWDGQLPTARLKIHLCSDLSFVTKLDDSGVPGSTTWVGSYPPQIYADGSFLYLLYKYDILLYKRVSSDLSHVSNIGSYGGGDDQFSDPFGMTGSAGYLYINDNQGSIVGQVRDCPNRINMRQTSDLSYVASYYEYEQQYNNSGDFAVALGKIFAFNPYQYVILTRDALLNYESTFGAGQGSGQEQFQYAQYFAVPYSAAPPPAANTSIFGNIIW